VADSQKSIPGEPSSLQQLRRLGRNINAYLGETIDIAAVLSDCVAAARAHGWTVEEIPAAPKPNLLAFTRPASGNALAQGAPKLAASSEDVHASRITHHVPSSRTPPHESTPPRVPRIYLSTGIHGDEPAGPLAVRQILRENQWPAAADLWLCPCLNPTGFVANRRENSDGIDLNREYLKPQAKETLAHIAWLERQPSFDLSLCLHEDWEAHGFYVYELNPDNQPSLAETIVARVAQVCPVDRSEIIEGRPAQNGIIRPGIDPRDRPQWPEAFFLLTHKTRLSYTLESPSDFPLPARVAALVVAVNAALEKTTSGCVTKRS
jgi:protein MpaA